MKVLVLELSHLHLGYLGCYGNDWIETPHLDRLAAEGVVFDRHYAADLGTCRAGRARFPQPTAATSPPPGVPLVEELLQQHGIAWQQFTQVPLVNDKQRLQPKLRKVLSETPAQGQVLWLELPGFAPPWKVAEPFVQHYFDSPEEAEFDEEDDEVEADEEAPDEEEAESEVSDEVEEVDEPAEPEEAAPPVEPWLAPPVGPVTLDDAEWERLQNTYAAVVSQFDAQLGVLLDYLDETGLADQVLILLTAARGLSLGERGFLGGDRCTLHEEVVHLPLILRFPDGRDAGRRSAALTQPADLLPTLLALFELPLPEGLHGYSLLPLAHGAVEQVRAYACSGAQAGECIDWALRTPEWAFLLPVQQAADDPQRGPQLFVKPDDRWEVNNLIQHHLELAEHLEKTLRAHMAASQQPGPWLPPPLVLEAPEPVASEPR